MPLHLLSKRFLRLWMAILALLVLAFLVLYSQSWQRGPSKIQLGSSITVTGHADTWTNIHPFLMFDGYISNPAAVAPRYDFVTGAKSYNVAAYRSTNPNIFLTYYITFHRDNGAFTDSTALKSLAGWRAIHPDWVLYRCDRVTPAYEFGNPNMPFDFSNPALVNWQVQNFALPASQNGYNGITADNVNLENLFGACGTYQNGKWVRRYTGKFDDPVWQADAVNWITRMQSALHNLPHPMALLLNLGFGQSLTPTSSIIRNVISHSDGVVDEAGFTQYGTGYLADGNWVRAIQLGEMIQAQGKPFYIVDNLPRVNRDGIQWALASYLMVKEHSSELFIAGYQDYGIDAWYNEYK
ncbi:MAG TPA: hypothetical protein VEL49_05510, partial [Ktedonobacteraceae bacterium]|nr:hypothetical protein [Ktedonobacteraceae bacterium]